MERQKNLTPEELVDLKELEEILYGDGQWPDEPTEITPGLWIGGDTDGPLFEEFEVESKNGSITIWKIKE